MRRVTLVSALALTLALSSGTEAQSEDGGGGSHTAAVLKWQAEVALASRRFGIPTEWIEAVITAESGGKIELDGRPITSPKGAMGLMQVMPKTYADMRARFDLGDDPYLPSDNILAGTAYLRMNFDRFGYPGLFAAYNAGPDRYERSLSGMSLPAETRSYVATILRSLSPVAVSPDAVFVNLTGPDPTGEEPPKPSVFVHLSDP